MVRKGKGKDKKEKEVRASEEEVRPEAEPTIRPAKADYYEKLFRGGK